MEGKTRLGRWSAATGVIDRSEVSASMNESVSWLSGDGRSLVRFSDGGTGSEVGHVERVDLESGECRSLTPGWAPYALRGGESAAHAEQTVFVACTDGRYDLVVACSGADSSESEPRVIFSSHEEMWTPRISADGTLVAVDTTALNPGRRKFSVVVWEIATATAMAQLALGGADDVRTARFSPVAGDPRLLLTIRRGDEGLARPAIWDPATGDQTLPVVPGADDAEHLPLDWAPDGTKALVCVDSYGAQTLFAHDIETGANTRFELPLGNIWRPNRREPQFLDSEAVLVTVDTAHRGLSAYRCGPDGLSTPVHLPGVPDSPRGRPSTSVRIRTSDGAELQGWLVTPVGEGPFPTIVYVHGGPHAQVVEGFDAQAQAWVADGYAHFSLNYRGSTGRGSRFARQIWPEAGPFHLDDLASTHQALVEAGISEPSRMFLTGESYGGFLSLLGVVRQPELWAAALPQVAIADWAANYHQSHPVMQCAFRNWFHGSPEEVPDRYRQASPATYVSSLEAPILAWHGTNDTRTPPGQLMDFVRAVDDRSGSVDVVWYEGGHEGPGSLAEVLSYQQRAHEFARGVLESRASS